MQLPSDRFQSFCFQPKLNSVSSADSYSDCQSQFAILDMRSVGRRLNQTIRSQKCREIETRESYSSIMEKANGIITLIIPNHALTLSQKPLDGFKRRKERINVNESETKRCQNVKRYELNNSN